MNLRFARPAHLVDINHLDVYDFHRVDGELVIGALTRHATLERARLQGPWGAFADALPHVGHHPIRVRGTFGGSISHADPTAELPLIAVTLDATFTVLSAGGRREVPAAALFQGSLQTDLRPEEMIVEARFEAPAPRTVSAFEEFSERSGDFALAAVCVAACFDEAGICSAAKVGLGAVAGTPFRARAAEAVLTGARLSEDVAREAAEAARRECDPPSTLAASSEFRRELVATLVQRALRRVAVAAREE
jgi:CO/xanthine dehydrogenase FAD-binding subunit